MDERLGEYFKKRSGNGKWKWLAVGCKPIIVICRWYCAAWWRETEGRLRRHNTVIWKCVRGENRISIQLNENWCGTQMVGLLKELINLTLYSQKLQEVEVFRYPRAQATSIEEANGKMLQMVLGKSKILLAMRSALESRKKTGILQETESAITNGLTLLTYPHAEAAATYPLLFFSTAITKSLILPKITTAWSYNCNLFLHTLFMAPFWYFY